MFFILSKIIAYIIYPTHLICILVGFYFLLSKFKKTKILSKLVLTFTSFLLLFGGSGYLSDTLLWKLESQIPVILPENASGIMVLGGAFNNLETAAKLDQLSFNEKSERFIETLFLLKKYQNSKVVVFANTGSLFSGGKPGSSLAMNFFKKFGINENRIVTKPLAQNTYQESVFLAEYISNIGGNWILVTSASHMPRAISLFQSRVLKDAIIYTYPTDHSLDKPIFSFRYHLGYLGTYRNAFHEYLGLFAYWITGRTKTLWPNLNMIPIKD